MAGTLTTLTGAASFGFRNNNRLHNSIESTSNVHIKHKPSLHALLNEPLVECTKKNLLSLYDVLNVKQNATLLEIKYAYRSLVKRYHPDATHSMHNGDHNIDDYDDGRDFIGICNAYVTLSDPTARAVYDMKLSTRFEPRRSGGMYPGRRWETDQCW